MKSEITDQSLYFNIDKIFEKLIHSRMIVFLESNKIILERQFGFRHKHSKVHGLIAITEKTKKYMDEGKITCGIYL